MILPNFFILGAPRAATTFLYRALLQHPHIFLSRIKEPSFFSEDARQPSWYTPRASQKRITTWEEYLALFAGAAGFPARGEASTVYLADPHAAKRIKTRLAEPARFIAVLRNPVERAYSHYVYHRMLNVEPEPEFEGALRDECRRQQHHWNMQWRYRETGLYAHHLQHYWDVFDSHQFLVLLHEDFQHPEQVFARVLTFLGVEEHVLPTDDKVNQSGTSRGSLASWLLQSKNPVKLIARRIMPAPVRRHMRQRLTQAPPPMPPAVRQQLVSYYRPDIEQLERLIGRDLEAWKH